MNTDPIIRVKRSLVQGKVPTVDQLGLGEIAINHYDAKVFIRQDTLGVGIGTTVIAIGSNQWKIKTSNYSAVSNDHIIADTSGGSFTITLPASPSTGDSIQLADGDDWYVNNLTIARNGSTIEGIADDLIIDVPDTIVTLIYDESTWQVFSQVGPQGPQGPQGIAGSSATINATDDTSTTTLYPVMVGATGSDQTAKGASTRKFVYNALTGNLGIGTTNPQYTLDVTGDINFNGSLNQNGSAFVASRWTAGTGNDIYRLNGDVGIGTTNPRFALEVGSVGASGTSLYVNGDARITGILTVGSSSITLDGTENEINVGSGVTIHHIDGIQVGQNVIHSSGLTINNLNISGISTLGVTSTTNLTAQQLNVSGVITASSFSGNTSSATALQNARTFEITGDVLGSPVSFDGTGNVSIAATIQPNSVGLGTDTTGDYVQNITGTANQITVTSGTGEGSTPTLSVPNQFTAPQDVTVTRDLQVNRNLNVNGSITIGGTSATLFTTELKIYDPDIVLGFRTDGSGNDVSTDTTANHGGIAIASTEGTPLISLYDVGMGETNPATYKKFMWFKSGTFSGLGTDAWISNYAIGIGSTQVPNGVRLAAGGMQVTDTSLSVPRLNISGVSTFTNGPVLVGSGSSTGTTSQPLQVTGGAYFSGNIGIGTTNPDKPLHIYTADGDVRIGDITEGTASTDAGVIFTGLGSNRSGLFTEVNGTLLSYGINCQQITGVETGRAGGVFRFDTRTSGSFNGSNCFTVVGKPIGTTTEYSAFVVGLNDGNTYLTPTRGNVLVGTSSSTGTSNQPLQVNGGAYVSGKLGIGATNPTPTLQVSGNYLSAATPTLGIATGNLYITNADPTYGLLIGNSSALGHSWLQVQRTDGTATAYNLSLEPSGGNVLVGTVSQTGTASQPLQVNGGGYFSGSVGMGTTNPLSASSQLHINNASYHGVSGDALLRLVSIGGINYLQSGITATSGSSAPLVFGSIFAGNEWARFTPSGNLLVGSATSTGTASQNLQVTGGAYVSGNVGVGTTRPLQNLHVQGNLLVAAGSSTAQHITQRAYELNNGTLSWEGSAGQLFSITNNLTSGSIFSVNDVSGIPSIDVDANGTVRLAQFGGNVGLGITNPTHKLSVVGDINFTGSLYKNGSPVTSGTSAGRVYFAANS